MGFGYFTYSHSLVPVIDLWISGRDKVGIRALIDIDELWCIVLCFLFTTAAIRLKFVIVIFLVLVFRCLNFVLCLFKLREELRTFLLLNQQRKVNIPFREKFLPIHPAGGVGVEVGQG